MILREHPFFRREVVYTVFPCDGDPWSSPHNPFGELGKLGESRSLPAAFRCQESGNPRSPSRALQPAARTVICGLLRGCRDKASLEPLKAACCMRVQWAVEIPLGRSFSSMSPSNDSYLRNTVDPLLQFGYNVTSPSRTRTMQHYR